MTVKKMVLLAALAIFTLIGCSKKNELVIMENAPVPSQQPAEAGTVDDGNAENKPLISIGRDDPLKIMVRQDGAPGMYLGEDGLLHGFYVDLEKMVMDEMNQAYELIPYEDVSPIVLKLKSGEVHVALAAPDLPEYRSFLNLSVPYEILNYVTFVRDGDTRFDSSSRETLIAGFSGKRIGVQAQGHIYQVLRDYRDIELIEYPTTTQALADLDKGLLDAVPDVKRIGEFYSEQEGWSIKPIGDAFISHDITTAFSQMLEPSVLERYNKALASLIERGEVKKLYESYFAPDNLYVAP